MTDSLIEPKRVDGFTHESPIRAFTDFKVNGKYAIGKGFRPAMAHLGAYLDAMHTKEGWALAQIILPTDSANDPTIIFWKSTYNPVMPELRDAAPKGAFEPESGRFVKLPLADREDDLGVEHDKPYRVEDDQGTQQVAFYSAGCWWQGDNTGGPDVQTEHPIVRIVPSTPDLEPVDHVGARPLCGYCNGSTVYMSEDIKTGAKTEVSCLHCNETGFADGLPRTIGKRPELGMGYQGELRDVEPGSPMADVYAEFAERERLNVGGFKVPILPQGEIIVDDPLNPKHYHGRECADIGELLTANSYQVLKYNWRLGEKDSPCVELGKAIWYLDSEIALATEDDKHGVAFTRRLPEHPWFDEKLRHATDHAKAVARILISWNRYGNIHSLRGLRKLLQTKLDEMNGCTEWGRGLEP